MKLIRQLEDLAFGTRLRLLTDRIHQDGGRVYKYLNIDFEPRWFALFYLLNEYSPIGVTEASQMLGYTQPAITQTANILVKKNLVKILKEKTDTRRRLLSLTDKGKELIEKLKPVWKAFEAATAELFKDTGFDVIMVISRLERELEKKDLYTRVTEKIKHTQSEQVSIVEYKPEYKRAFKELNFEWLNKYFRIEKQDEIILGDPEKNILSGGGHIFFGKLDGNIVGTAALIKHENKTFELTKMAVTERAQGMQIGRKLAVTAIEKVKSENGEKIFLETNKKLISAMNLYHSLGFEQVTQLEESKYERATITMELKLH